MTWTAEQHRLLAAMGLEPMAPAAHAPAAGRAQITMPEVALAAVGPGASGEAESFAALRRSVRLAAGGREPNELSPDYQRLRRDPAFKRAFWPMLRALRRSR